ncbi:MAG: AAA family ATPase [Muribaculaceae bacterium]|nr:AAA family ATPase [Muribaculaceae bacterium]
MIQKITISNFFSIREPLEVSFEASKEKQYGEDWITQIGNVRLLKALILYGANGSGKTNILCALDFLRYAIIRFPVDEDDDFKYMRFALDPEYAAKDSVFDLFFFIGDVRYRYYLEISPKRITKEELRVYHNGNNSRAIYTRKYNAEKDVHTIRFGTWMSLSPKDRKTVEDNTKDNISVLSVYASKNISCNELKVVRNYFRYEFFKIYRLQDGDQEVAKALKDDNQLKMLLVDLIRTFHSNIVDVKVEEETRAIPEEARQILLQMKHSDEEREFIEKLQTLTKLTSHYIHKTRLGEFSLEDRFQSEGTRSFIRHLVLFYKSIQNGWLIALDEFGAGMQAKTQHLLLEFFLKFTGHSQLIFATQSIGFLDYPKMRRDAIDIVSKDDIGQTHIDANTVKGIHKNIKLRKAYTDGRFTTIDPNEPDIDLNDEYNWYKSLIFADRKEETI